MSILKKSIGAVVFVFACCGILAAQQVFFEDFETGGTDWTNNGGVWEIGTPTAGPASAYSGTHCAGTVLSGNYPAYQDARLIYPKESLIALDLPPLTGDREYRLRFWYWCSYSSYDAGYVQVSAWDDQAQQFLPFETVPQAKALTGVYIDKWMLQDVDLTSYAGKSIKLGFYHTADRNVYGHASESTGWYIDDVEIVAITPTFTGDFEAGLGHWVVEDDLWEVGIPTAGPPSAFEGDNCVGTVLDGNYQGYRDSRLITPSIRLQQVQGNEKLWISYWQWWSNSSYDYGQVEISEFDDQTGTWSAWDPTPFPGSYISGVSPVWSGPNELELTQWAGKKVRIAFAFYADRNVYGHSSESTGWYIDQVELFKMPPDPEPPTLDIKANGAGGPLWVTRADDVAVAVSLDAGNQAGAPVEIWVGALSMYGTFWCPPTMSWSTTRASFDQGPLADIPETVVLNRKLPTGLYAFFVILDGTPDNNVDIGMIEWVIVICK